MLYNVNDLYVGRSLELYGESSPLEIELFDQVLRPGMLVVDAGANIGVHTLYFAKKVARSGMVVAFEPQEVVFQTLYANMALNSITNAHCYHLALGATRGAVSVSPVDYSRAGNFAGLAFGQSSARWRVDQIPLDALKLPNCHLLKVDVEGMEQAVLTGARRTIANHKPLLYVENDRKEKAADLIRFIASLGYDLFWHTPPLFHPENFFGNPHNVFGDIASLNMVCVPRGGWARIGPHRRFGIRI